jgi:ankyrin repeat/BTB/POZ domain-containing protein 1
MGSLPGGIEFDIYQAARAGDCARLAYLVKRGADLNACDRWDSIPLYYACLAGKADAVRLLLEAGTVCDVSTFEGERCYRAALNLGIRTILRQHESWPRPPLPPLARLPAVLHSAFLACPANRAAAESLPTGTDQLWPQAPPDITLYVQGRPIEAHRVILAARSPYFRTKLATEWRNRKVVTFSGSHSLSFELMHSLVSFFYSDRLEVPVDDIEDLVRICKACKCKGILDMLNRLIADRNTRTRQFDVRYPPLRPLVLQGRSMKDRLPSALRRFLQDCLANSKEEDLHDSQTCSRSSSAHDDLADIRIKVGDRVFRCHQLILTLGSEYFKTRLSRRADFLERHYSAGELPILEEHDVSIEAFEKMLGYVYTDELEHLGDDPLFLSEELLGVASRYLLFPLKRVVADLLLPHLNLGRVPPAERGVPLADAVRHIRRCQAAEALRGHHRLQLRGLCGGNGVPGLATHASS